LPYAEQHVFERKGNEYDDDDEESKQVSLRREYQCFKCMKTGHIARNCQVSDTAHSKSVYKETRSKEEEKLKKRTSEVALLMHMWNRRRMQMRTHGLQIGS